MADERKNSPDYTCAAYHKMTRAWQVMADTTAGTLALRDAGAAYLPLEPAENDKHYQYRRLRAIFFNAVDRTLNGLVGMVYRNDPQLAENVPETIRGREAEGEATKVEGQWENIDSSGTHGTVFTKEVFSNAMRDGHAAILVDMPPALPEGATRADEIAANRRPYWVSYCADQIINFRTEVVAGQTRLALVVLKEKTQEPDGLYGEQEVTRYRVLRPGSWELWREVNENSKKEIILEDTGATSLTEIPLAIVYSRKTGWLQSQPPLLDLALINIAHYQKYNDFSIYIHLCRPILCRKPADTQKPITTVSAYTVMETSAEGDIWFAEPTGGGLDPSSQDLKDLEERMSILGLSLLVRRTGAQTTATEERNDQIEESSDLATAARSLKDAIELCLKFHGQYLTPDAQVETGGNVELGASLDAQEITPEEMTAWSDSVAAGQFTLETMWGVFAAGGKLPSDFDPKAEKAALEAEAKKKQEAEIAMQDAISRNFDRGGAAEE